MTVTVKPITLAVLVSGQGTNLQALLDSIAAGTLQARVKLVLSNRQEAGALARAKKYEVPTVVLSEKDYTRREAFDQAMIQAIDQAGAELIVLAGFMRLLSAPFVKHYRGRLINIHPALLPAFPGLNAIQKAFDYGVPLTGCTVHFVDEGTDTGPIIAQSVVWRSPRDTLESLTEKVHQAEHQLYPKIIQLFAEKRAQFPKNGRTVFILDALVSGKGDL